MIRELISTALTKALVSGHYERPHDRVADCPLAYLYRTPSSVAHFPRARRLNDLGPLWLFAVYFFSSRRLACLPRLILIPNFDE